VIGRSGHRVIGSSGEVKQNLTRITRMRRGSRGKPKNSPFPLLSAQPLFHFSALSASHPRDPRQVLRFAVTSPITRRSDTSGLPCRLPSSSALASIRHESQPAKQVLAVTVY
jgi:hypothetical protein